MAPPSSKILANISSRVGKRGMTGSWISDFLRIFSASAKFPPYIDVDCGRCYLFQHREGLVEVFAHNGLGDAGRSGYHVTELGRGLVDDLGRNAVDVAAHYLPHEVENLLLHFSRRLGEVSAEFADDLHVLVLQRRLRHCHKLVDDQLDELARKKVGRVCDDLEDFDLGLLVLLATFPDHVEVRPRDLAVKEDELEDLGRTLNELDVAALAEYFIQDLWHLQQAAQHPAVISCWQVGLVVDLLGGLGRLAGFGNEPYGLDPPFQLFGAQQTDRQVDLQLNQPLALGLGGVDTTHQLFDPHKRYVKSFLADVAKLLLGDGRHVLHHGLHKGNNLLGDVGTVVELVRRSHELDEGEERFDVQRIRGVSGVLRPFHDLVKSLRLPEGVHEIQV